MLRLHIRRSNTNFRWCITERFVGAVPAGIQRLKISATPGARLTRCEHPDGSFTFLAKPPGQGAKPIVLFRFEHASGRWNVQRTPPESSSHAFGILGLPQNLWAQRALTPGGQPPDPRGFGGMGKERHPVGCEAETAILTPAIWTSRPTALRQICSGIISYQNIWRPFPGKKPYFGPR